MTCPLWCMAVSFPPPAEERQLWPLPQPHSLFPALLLFILPPAPDLCGLEEQKSKDYTNNGWGRPTRWRTTYTLSFAYQQHINAAHSGPALYRDKPVHINFSFINLTYLWKQGNDIKPYQANSQGRRSCIAASWMHLVLMISLEVGRSMKGPAHSRTHIKVSEEENRLSVILPIVLIACQSAHLWPVAQSHPILTISCSSSKCVHSLWGISILLLSVMRIKKDERSFWYRLFTHLDSEKK